MNPMFEPVVDAGITQAELAKIAQVSRLTANKWMNGRTKPHVLHVDKVTTLLSRIGACVSGGQLPLSPRIKRDERIAKLQEMLQPEV